MYLCLQWIPRIVIEESELNLFHRRFLKETHQNSLEKIC